MSGPTIIPDPPDLLRAELDDGENVIWWGRPDMGAVRRSQRREYLVVACLGLAFLTLGSVAFFSSEPRTIASQKPSLIAPFLIIAFGPALLLGPLTALTHRVSRRRLRASIYAVTNTRAIILFAGRHGVETHSIPRAYAIRIRRIPRAPGVADIVFEDRVSSDRSVGSSVVRGFVCIHDAAAVERLVRQSAAR